MMIGKRPRHHIKRTTSMSEFSMEDLTLHQPQPSDHSSNHHEIIDQSVMSLVSPRNINMMHRRNSADSSTFRPNYQNAPPPFLNSCSLCRRRLPPGRDIYMYRGDSAFCSLECRQQQMTQDEKATSSVGPLQAGSSSTNPGAKIVAL